MKKVIVTLGIVVSAAICMALFQTTASENREAMAFDLAQSDDTFCDMIFDKDGKLISMTTYKWNATNNTKGEILVAYND